MLRGILPPVSRSGCHPSKTRRASSDPCLMISYCCMSDEIDKRGASRRQLPRNARPHTRPYLQTFRTKLRKSLTPTEATLWKALQRSKLDGRKFRRQHSVGNYILDFYCVSERLAVELDGNVHFDYDAILYDTERKMFLKDYGIKVLRFENRLVWMQALVPRDSTCRCPWKSGTEKAPPTEPNCVK